MKKNDESIIAFNKAVELDFKLHKAYDMIGIDKLKIFNWLNLLYFYFKGIIYFEMNQFEKAIVAYTSAIKIKEDVQYLCKKGRCYLKLNFPKSALVCFNRATNLDPTFPQTYRYKGTSYYVKFKNKFKKKNLK